MHCTDGTVAARTRALLGEAMRRPKLSATHGTARLKGEGIVIAITDGVVWFRFGEFGRLKCPKRTVKGAIAIGSRLRVVQVGDTIVSAEVKE